MHNGMQYDPIQGQGHELSIVGNPAILKSYLLPKKRSKSVDVVRCYSKPKQCRFFRQCIYNSM